ncbi:hypothetical protein [Rhodococcus spongiicola]|uniref:Uncharacterized protein n=1 Tax=Rhodococcus spongiicola TaxID=2487352 RepID=A0A3S3E5W2_9NOCA|nr:hypothetical protein [Rhodococcus spongiicola]RVW06058.1 hypothetical protein EF834_00905 [Rhodococcus spongiicola]
MSKTSTIVKRIAGASIALAAATAIAAPGIAAAETDVLAAPTTSVETSSELRDAIIEALDDALMGSLFGISERGFCCLPPPDAQ